MAKFQINSRTKDNLAWVLLIGVVFFSVIRTQSINNELVETQQGIVQSQNCTEQFLGATVKALNERTEYTQAQAQANVSLQKAQLEFISILVIPDKRNDQDGLAALQEYFRALQEYNKTVSLSTGKADRFPYPTSEDYRECLSASHKGES